MMAAGAHTPREKTLRPFFSCTTQCSPAAFTRRVSAASPGGSSAQPSGTVSTSPLAARTVPGEGPGANVIPAAGCLGCLSLSIVLNPLATAVLPLQADCVPNLGHGNVCHIGQAACEGTANQANLRLGRWHAGALAHRWTTAYSSTRARPAIEGSSVSASSSMPRIRASDWYSVG